MPTGKKIEKWEKEFDDEFKGENEFENGDYIVEDQAIYIKNFISDLLSSQLKEVQKYRELIMAVENKYKGETRHETALRYIKQAEEGRAESAELSQLAEGEELEK